MVQWLANMDDMITWAIGALLKAASRSLNSNDA